MNDEQIGAALRPAIEFHKAARSQAEIVDRVAERHGTDPTRWEPAVSRKACDAGERMAKLDNESIAETVRALRDIGLTGSSLLLYWAARREGVGVAGFHDASYGEPQGEST